MFVNTAIGDGFDVQIEIKTALKEILLIPFYYYYGQV